MRHLFVILSVMWLLMPCAGYAQTPSVPADAPPALTTQARRLLVKLRSHPADTAAVRLQLALAAELLDNDNRRADSVLAVARALAKRLGAGGAEGAAWELTAAVAIGTGRYDDALAAEARALPLLHRAGKSALEFDARTGQGIARLRLGDLPGATAAFLASLRIAEATHDAEQTGKALNNLGNVEFRLTRLPQAAAYYRQFLRIATDSAQRAGVLVNLANIAIRQGNPDSALVCAQQAVALARPTGDEGILGMSLGVLAAVYATREEYGPAAATFAETVALAEADGNPQPLVVAMMNLASCRSQLNPRDATVPTLLRRAQTLAHKNGLLDEERNAFLVLSETAEARGDYRAALADHQRLRALTDSLFTIDAARQTSELQVRYETEKKEQQNRIKTLQIAEKDLIIRRRNALLLALLIGLAAAGVVAWLLRNRARLRARLDAERAQRRQQQERAAAVIEAEERERRRIGADLHDSVGQLLAAAKLNLSGLQHELQLREPAQEVLLTNALDTLDESLREVRALSHQLVPNALLRRGLVAAVREFVEKLGGAGQLRIELETMGLDQRLPLVVENVVYRSIQEIVANVVKHARASQVMVQLLGQPTDLTVLIEDNGIGFDVAEALARPDAGIGLRNLFSRVEYLGGRIDIDARPGRGTIVTLEIPLEPAAAETVPPPLVA